MVRRKKDVLTLSSTTEPTYTKDIEDDCVIQSKCTVNGDLEGDPMNSLESDSELQDKEYMQFSGSIDTDTSCDSECLILVAEKRKSRKSKKRKRSMNAPVVSSKRSHELDSLCTSSSGSDSNSIEDNSSNTFSLWRDIDPQSSFNTKGLYDIFKQGCTVGTQQSGGITSTKPLVPGMGVSFLPEENVYTSIGEKWDISRDVENTEDRTVFKERQKMVWNSVFVGVQLYVTNNSQFKGSSSCEEDIAPHVVNMCLNPETYFVGITKQMACSVPVISLIFRHMITFIDFQNPAYFSSMSKQYQEYVVFEIAKQIGTNIHLFKSGLLSRSQACKVKMGDNANCASLRSIVSSCSNRIGATCKDQKKTIGYGSQSALSDSDIKHASQRCSESVRGPTLQNNNLYYMKYEMMDKIDMIPQVYDVVNIFVDELEQAMRQNGAVGKEVGEKRGNTQVSCLRGDFFEGEKEQSGNVSLEEGNDQLLNTIIENQGILAQSSVSNTERINKRMDHFEALLTQCIKLTNGNKEDFTKLRAQTKTREKKVDSKISTLNTQVKELRGVHLKHKQYIDALRKRSR